MTKDWIDPMANPRRTLLRYGSAILAIIAAAGARRLLVPLVGDQYPLGTFFLALVFAAWSGGLGPALVALALSLVLIPLVLRGEVHGGLVSWTVAAHVSSLRYFLAGLAIALLGGSMRVAQRRAEEGEERAGRALDAERAHRERLRVTLQSITDGIIVTTSDGLVTSLNRVAERLTGWSTAEAAGLPLREVFRTVDQTSHRTAEMPVAQVVQEGHAYPMDQTELVPRGGKPLTIEHGTAPIRGEGETIDGVVIIFRDVTERRRAEERLRQSEERFARFMQQLPGLAWIKDVQGRYVYANEAAEKAFRTTIARLYGRTDDQVFPPETAAQFRRNDRQALQSTTGVKVIETLEQADGVVHHSVVSKFPIAGPDGKKALIGGIAIDITDLKRAEDALKQSEVQFRTLADSIPQLAWMARPDGAIFWYNRRWYDYTGATPETMEGWGWQSVLDPELLPRVLARYRTAIAGGQPWEDTFPIRRHDGAMRWHLSRALPVHDEHGTVVRWFGTNTDITDRMEMEAALKEADRRKDEFLATLAHELRNPLAPIRNALYLMAHPPQNGQSFETERAMAERQVVHLARLVDDLMDIARISRGKIELRKEPVDLKKLVGRAVDSVRSMLEERGHALTVRLPDDPVTLEADPTRLEQVLGNLLNNAAKYTEPGGRIELTAGREGREVVVSVRDSGIGIAPAMVHRIFEMFVQAVPQSGRSQGGLGIGLNLVKTLVEMHGGTIEARSAGIGHGSEFILRLPALAANTEQPTAPDSPAHAASPAALASRRVLVVDDNVDAARSLARLLSRIYGQQVRTAHDGFSALEEASSFLPEIVLLDIGMPGMDGYELARRLRARPESESALLVALTGWGQESDREKSLAAGINVHMVKPVDPDELRRLLANGDVA
jgi:PAS domain S-box-containing protein